MRATRCRVGAALAGLAVVTAGATARQQQSVFRSGVDVVFVDVSVTDHHVPVRDLSSADFTLTDNGVTQDIDAVSMESMPIDVTLLLDVSGSVGAGVLQGLTRSIDDTSRALGERDRVRLLTFSHAVRQGFPYRPGGAPPNLDHLRAGGSTSIYDALAAAMMQPRAIGRRQMILVFTDGADSRSFMRPDSVQRLAGASDAVVHFAIGLRRGAVDVPRKWQLAEIAAATGGDITVFRADSALPTAFNNILDRFRTSYVLRYTPQGVAPDGWHAITVRVSSPAYDVRSKKGWLGQSR